MKEFIGKTTCLLLMTVLIIVLLFILRFVFWNQVVAEEYSLPEGVEVVCIGNSHTGCTWIESVEFRNRKIWHTGTGFLFALFRLRELERLGELHKIKVCIMDCDQPAMAGFKKEIVKKNFFSQFPIAWRYMNDISLSKEEVAFAMIDHAFDGWSIMNDEPVGWSNRQWNKVPSESRKRHINDMWHKISEAQKPDAYIPLWEDKFMSCVKEAKEICARNNVRLILFAAPLASDFPLRSSTSDVCSVMIGRIKTLGIEYYDFRHLYNDDKFMDTHHLTKSAAYEFTHFFWREIVSSSLSKH